MIYDLWFLDLYDSFGDGKLDDYLIFHSMIQAAGQLLEWSS